MNRPVYVHPHVQKFLDDNAAWSAEHHSPAEAERWYDGFVDALLALEHNPQSRPLAAENERFSFDVRELHYGAGSKPTHRALFTIRPEKVYVFLARHVSQRVVRLDDLR